MTREEAAKWAELYQAYADGKVIQFYDGGTAWVECDKLRSAAYPPYLYRIKPEPKKAEFWLNVYGEYLGTYSTTKEEADRVSGRGRTACLHIVREYEEGEGL